MFIEFGDTVYNTDYIVEAYKATDKEDYQIIIGFKEEVSTSFDGLLTKRLDFHYSDKEKRDTYYEELINKLMPYINENQLNEDIDCAMHEFIAKNKKD